MNEFIRAKEMEMRMSNRVANVSRKPEILPGFGLRSGSLHPVQP
jgi:hypothetical protein